ncbi:unnamed protein product [Enterobius vermicularis]|uniref:Uncharacterized protein n=1 Tax=Enterobius vermicularis TaxID=51028 RepID=A0A0N4UTT1_ENTVE|nr:unnamed protein product [Enterobius vermicularis]
MKFQKTGVQDQLMELPLPTKTPITTGTKLCGKVQQVVFNMTEAFGEWKCRLDPLGS